MNPSTDGQYHINIYSKGQTELGRILSNFAYTPIVTEDGQFNSIEGYWYWLSCGNDILRNVYGWEAKKLGREFGGKDWCDEDEFKDKICKAIQVKLETPEVQKIIKSNLNLIKLPFKHYYVYDNKVIEPKDGKWIITFIKKCIMENYGGIDEK